MDTLSTVTQGKKQNVGAEADRPTDKMLRNRKFLSDASGILRIHLAAAFLSSFVRF